MGDDKEEKKGLYEKVKEAFVAGRSFVVVIGMTGAFGMGVVETLTEDEAKEKAEKGIAVTAVVYKQTIDKINAIDSDLDDHDTSLEICLDAASKLEEVEEIVEHLQEYHDKRDLVERIEALERGASQRRSRPAPILPASVVHPEGNPHEAKKKQINRAKRASKAKKRKSYQFSEPEDLFGEGQKEQKAIPPEVQTQMKLLLDPKNTK